MESEVMDLAKKAKDCYTKKRYGSALIAADEFLYATKGDCSTPWSTIALVHAIKLSSERNKN